MSTQVQTRQITLRLPGTTKITVSARGDSDTDGQRLCAFRFHSDDPAVPAITIEAEGASDDAIKVPTPEGTF